ncbi:MAG: DUF6446 family protein [Paracoccaceae bacterium]|jgi:hypothetical protein
MAGKIAVIAIVLSALMGGAAMYYLQVYAYYYDVEAQAGRDVMLMTNAEAEPQPIAYSDFRGIDATSSPIRYRACFVTEVSPEQASESYMETPDASPRIAPSWFGCFDAEAIGNQIEAGTARAFLSAKNIAYGIDRIVVLTDDGLGFAWHEPNECGTKAYDGTVVGEECPPPPVRD